MSSRILLAVLVLTNPICCQMFGSAEEARPIEHAPSCDDCCCECENRDGPPTSSDDSDTPHAPCGCPNCELCQCVCAGAVIADSVVFDASSGSIQFDGIFEVTVHNEPVPDCRSTASNVQMPRDVSNVGRIARILLSSLLF